MIKSKSKSLAAIMATLTPITPFAFASAQINDGGGGAEAAAAVVPVPPSSSSSSSTTASALSRHNDHLHDAHQHQHALRSDNDNGSGNNGRRRRLRRWPISSGNKSTNSISSISDNKSKRTGRQTQTRLVSNEKKKASSSENKKSLTKRRLVSRQTTSSTTTTTSSTAASAPGCGPSPGTHHSPYIGCYTDRVNDRAFPYELHGNMSNAKRFGHGALDCERECSTRGFQYFGREFKGQCFCGNALESITRFERAEGRCDCCGGNVGGGKMCVWENANHSNSQASVPNIPVIIPQLNHQQPSTVVQQPLHSHSITTFTSLQPSSNNNQNSHRVSATAQTYASTHKPTGGFRIRLHWQQGYNWQNSRQEKHYCMECRGACRSGSSIQIDTCRDDTLRQKFIAVDKTIRPASNPALCLTVTGYAGTKQPVKLRHCNRGTNQNFMELRSSDKFELQPQTSNGGRCLSQHHHPKSHEVVFPEDCEKTRRFDTTYWRII